MTPPPGPQPQEDLESGSDEAVDGFWAVVPAGGAGTRLWPLSREGSPKFLHDLTGTGRSLLQATWDRLVPLTGQDRLLVVTGAAHAGAVRDQLPGLGDGALLAEPSPRDSMAAIGLAAAVVLRRDPDAVIGSFAADHVITDLTAFEDAVRQAVAVASQGWVVTIGIEPTHPSTAFGYIRAGAALDVPGAPSASRADAFVEKPDAATAAGYLAAGGHRWNAGMFVSRADVLLGRLRENHPQLCRRLVAVAEAWETPARDEALAEHWPQLTRIAIDHAVAEPTAAAGGVAVVPGRFDWDDVGDWDSLADLVGARDGGTAVLGQDGDVVSLGSGGVVVPASGRVVALLGMEDVVVVDTPDALLVTTRDQAQRVREVVDALRRGGRPDVL